MLRNGTEALRIEPIDELVFKGPFTKIVTRELNLKNMADRPICFKVKTTAPKQYCVRPNSGIIGAGGANSVSIMLQPFDIAQQSIKHKFLIQSAFVPPGEKSFEGAWSRIAPSELVNSKLRVVFEEPSSAQHQHEECSKLIQNGAELESRIRTMGANENTLSVAANENVNGVIKVSPAAHSMDSFPSDAGVSNPNSGISVFLVVMIALFALLVGLIFGKLL